MGKVEISVDDYVNAPNGSLLIKINGKWVAMTLKELLDYSNIKLKDDSKLSVDIQNISRNIKHFSTYAKSHFMVVFNAFKIAILGGLIDVSDKELLDLDEQVLQNKISVQDAIKKHPYIENLFNQLFVDNEEVYKEV